MVLGEFDGDETGHERFAFEAKKRPGAFEEGAEPIGGALADPLREGFLTGADEQAIDEDPELHGFALREEVRLAVGAADEERIERAEVRVGGGIDVRDVDLVLAIADDAELAGAGPGEDAWEEVIVSGAPDQVRAQGADLQFVRSGLQGDLLGDGLSLGVSAEPVVAVG